MRIPIYSSIFIVIIGLVITNIAGAAPVDSTGSLGGPPIRVLLCRRLDRCRNITAQAISISASNSHKNAVLSEQGQSDPNAGYRITVNGSRVQVSSATGMQSKSYSRFKLPNQTGAVWLIAGGSEPARAYRGSLSFTVKNGYLRIINVLPLEDYLRGVLPPEIGPDAPIEALKAQAVVSRTFALMSMMTSQNRDYDVTDTTASQIYNGFSAENARTDGAIQDTAGLVLHHNGKLFLAEYGADCGGVTAGGDSPSDYPPSVMDSAGPGQPDYCANGRYHSWTLTMAPAQISRLLDAYPRTRVGDLKQITVLQADVSGRAAQIQLSGSEASPVVTGVQLRSALGYSVLKSTLFTVQQDQNGNFIFDGRGYGAGAGLCQDGAIGMAGPPYRFNYQQILEHYFPNSEIVSDANSPSLSPTQTSEAP